MDSFACHNGKPARRWLLGGPVDLLCSRQQRISLIGAAT
jgi:hypothetical protein